MEAFRTIASALVTFRHHKQQRRQHLTSCVTQSIRAFGLSAITFSIMDILSGTAKATVMTTEEIVGAQWFVTNVIKTSLFSVAKVVLQTQAKWIIVSIRTGSFRPMKGHLCHTQLGLSA